MIFNGLINFEKFEETTFAVNVNESVKMEYVHDTHEFVIKSRRFANGTSVI